jgi:DNA-binding LacI/PurR family transcriptional regulator
VVSYRSIYSDAEGKIVAGGDGVAGKAPTMADVAARAGVSRALVSTVFRGVPGASPATRQRVLDAAAELGYQVDNRARLLRSSRTRLVGVVFRVQDAFHAELVEALYKAAATSDYDMVLSGTTAERSELTAAESLLNDRCEALVLVSPQMSEAELGALGERAPTIVLARRARSAAVDVVMTADLEVVRTALDHLVSLGHRDIAHLDGGSIHGATDRRRGYRTLMRRWGLTQHIKTYAGGNTEADGMRAAELVAAEAHPPTAVVAFNDRSAVGLIFGLRRAGLSVPEDISIIGYDDIPMATLPFVDLTTVGQDATATAQQAFEDISGRLDGNASAGTQGLVSPYLAVRSTTAAPTTSAPSQRVSGAAG